METADSRNIYNTRVDTKSFGATWAVMGTTTFAWWESLMQKFFKNESGATAIEYGLIAALVAVSVIGAVTTLGSNTSKTFNKVAAQMG